VCILADADSDGQHIATLLCALFRPSFQSAREGRSRATSPCRRSIASTFGKNVYYALDDAERSGVLDRIEAEGVRGKVSVTRFKGLGEMSPSQLRETGRWRRRRGV
jgi:topoisomerase-4 subunit B